MTMKTITLITALFLLVLARADAQPNEFLNIGLRLGWMLGDGGGAIVGVEASYTWLDSDTFTHGPVVGADVHRGDVRVHAGYEIIAPRLPIGGIEVGPTLRLSEEGPELGVHLTPFIGWYGYPYYSATVYGSGGTQEVGAFLKFPIQIDDRPVVNF
jgi:hypothetical protein